MPEETHVGVELHIHNLPGIQVTQDCVNADNTPGFSSFPFPIMFYALVTGDSQSTRRLDRPLA